MLTLFVLLTSLLERRRDDGDTGDRGATMIEYGLMVVGIAVVVGVAAAALGVRATALFDGVIPG